jgi:hypothetical protein
MRTQGTKLSGVAGGIKSSAVKSTGKFRYLRIANPELLVQCPLDERKDRTKQEEEDETVVTLAVREETLRANYTPLQGDILASK